jgi:hypothetical protein
MNRQLTLYCAMLRKDLRLFWQFGALIAGLLVIRQFPDLIAQIGTVGALMQIALQLGCVLLILVVCYEDAVVSLQHDWLTRPISGLTVLLAKGSFVFLAVLLPAVLGALAYNLYEGRSLAESVVAGIAIGASGGLLLMIAIVMAFAAVTTGIRQGIIVFLVGMVTLMVAALVVTRVTGGGEGSGASGSGWVLAYPVILLLFFVALLVLWVQYRHRHTRAARTIVAVAVVIGTAYPATMSWPNVFALQARLAPEPAAEASVQLELAPGCFPVQPLYAAESRAVAAQFPDEDRQRAGADAMVLTTRLIRSGIRAGDRLHIGRVEITYRSAGGKALQIEPGSGPTLWTSVDSGLLAANHSWLLSRADYARLAATEGIEAQLEYSVNLLGPAAEARIIADGRREYYPGIGHCSANFDPALGRVSVDCFKAGALPAQLVANLEGAPEIAGKTSGIPHYAPTLINFWGGRRYNIELQAAEKAAPRVIVTAFKARAHFTRQFVVPGVLGGPVAACPAP